MRWVGEDLAGVRWLWGVLVAAYQATSEWANWAFWQYTDKDSVG